MSPPSWGPDLTAGGGMDYETPWLNHHLAIRLFQADYEYMHADWGQATIRRPGQHQCGAVERGRCASMWDRLLLRPPVTLACSASPESVFPGDPVTLTATAGEPEPQRPRDL